MKLRNFPLMKGVGFPVISMVEVSIYGRWWSPGYMKGVYFPDVKSGDFPVTCKLEISQLCCNFPSFCNNLPPEIRSLPRDLSSSFYKLFKTFIFVRALAGSASE